MKNGKFIQLPVLLLLIILIASCKINNDGGAATKTSQTETAAIEPIQTPSKPAELLPIKTVTQEEHSSNESRYPDRIAVPDWVKNRDNEYYLCLSMARDGKNYLTIIDPVWQDRYYLPIEDNSIYAYFWLNPPENGIGWLELDQIEYSILNFDTGKIDTFPLSGASKEFLALSYTSISIALMDTSHPVRMIESGADVFFIREDRDTRGNTFSKNLSPDERYYIYNVGNDKTENISYIEGYDLHEKRYFQIELSNVTPLYSPINWSPISPAFAEIGDYVIDISEGTIVMNLPKAAGDRAWLPDGSGFFYTTDDPFSWDSDYYLLEYEGVSLYQYNLKDGTSVLLDKVDDYFKGDDTFGLENEVLYNLTYIPEINSLGFSYFGQRKDGENSFVLWGAGGYCLFSFSTYKINCITDDIVPMTHIQIEEENISVREAVGSAQWSESKRFIALYVRMGSPGSDDIEYGRTILYDLETQQYMIIKSNEIMIPLGIWSPVQE